MQSSDILRIRLHNQLLNGSHFSRPEEIVAHMGAMQSQAFEMAKWGIGVRLPGSTSRSIEEAINQGKIIRTHILRPTWHFVSASDIHWMLDLSVPRLKPVYDSYHRMTGVDKEQVIKVTRIVERVLSDHNCLTRQELADRVQAEGIPADNRLMTHAMGEAEIEKIVCNGPVKGNKQTYALLQEWVPGKNTLSKDESLERLARAFFTSHAPATLQDFVWWSGMLTSDARKAIAAISHDFISETVNGRTFLFHRDTQLTTSEDTSALLLPAFDEFIVSYKDREEILEKELHRKIITKTGVFSPTIMHNGYVIGSWKKGKAGADLSFFEKTDKKTSSLFEKAIQRYKEYIGK